MHGCGYQTAQIWQARDRFQRGVVTVVALRKKDYAFSVCCVIFRLMTASDEFRQNRLCDRAIESAECDFHRSIVSQMAPHAVRRKFMGSNRSGFEVNLHEKTVSRRRYNASTGTPYELQGEV